MPHAETSRLYSDIRKEFVQRYGKEPLLIRSPARINMIGEHTDYNNGFVMPAAIDKEIVFAIAASSDRRSEVFSLNTKDGFDVDLENPQPSPSSAWSNYILGMLRQCVDQEFELKPFSCLISGNIPAGAGLSSSAAMTCGFGFALNTLFDLELERMEIARMGQWSEHNFVGVKCGIMDQFANMMGQPDHVLMLDCRSMRYDALSLPMENTSVVLIDTRVKHALAESEYNTRREECEEGVRILQQYHPEVKSLRDAELPWLKKHESEFPEKVLQRCRYVLEENQRVMAARERLMYHDLGGFGALMFKTHKGLSEEYEVSCEELDFLVTHAASQAGVLGARMMGGGFGGCTVNLVRSENLNQLIDITEAYKKKFGTEPAVYTVTLCGGTSTVSEK